MHLGTGYRLQVGTCRTGPPTYMYLCGLSRVTIAWVLVAALPPTVRPEQCIHSLGASLSFPGKWVSPSRIVVSTE